MKTENCPICGQQPTTISAAGLYVTGCLAAKHERNGQPGSTLTESKKAWNQYVREQANGRAATGYEPQRFYGGIWEEALHKAADCARMHYRDNEDYA
jgi:hypothetical protein